MDSLAMFRSLLIDALRAVTRVLFRVRVRAAREHFERSPLLICANHESFIDGLLLALFLPVKPVFVVHTTVLRRPLFRLGLSLVEHFAVDPANPMAIKKIVKLVEQGRPVVIFPEGRISLTGGLMKIYDGAAFVAAKTGASVVRVRLDGPARSLFSRLSAPHPRKMFPQMSLTALAPVLLEMPQARLARERRRLAGEKLRVLMQEALYETQPLGSPFDAFLGAMKLRGRNAPFVEDLRQKEESYGQVLKMVVGMREMARPLAAEGEPVGVLLPNATPCLALILALNSIRRPAAMLNYTSGPQAMLSCCLTVQAQTVVSSRAFLAAAKLDAHMDALAKAGVRVLFLEDMRAQFGFAQKARAAFDMLFPRFGSLEARPSDRAAMLFTSGTEGSPKAVVHTNESLMANVAQSRAVADFGPNDKFLTALPLFHCFGFTCGTLLPMASGSRLLLYPSPLHWRAIPEASYDRRCTVMLGTPTFFSHYARFAHPYDFHTVRYAICGAEKLPDSVRQLWQDKLGLRLLEGYGATETAPLLAVNTPMAFCRGSVGQLVPGVQWRLEPVEGIEGAGELHVRGRNLMAGYMKADQPGVLVPPSSSAGEGWHSMGDVCAFNEEGYLFVRGRLGRFAKIAGEKIDLEASEAIARAASPKAQHAVVSVPDAKKGEALLLLTTDASLSREALARAARETGAAELAIPRHLSVVDAIPLLGTGKVNYGELKRVAAEWAARRAPAAA
jgi:acyl-[acyl-carrier-protein]-phospholipid O-acyltransferase / long-chain-fatty-acid--[acyl-carrier-protein] ligase